MKNNKNKQTSKKKGGGNKDGCHCHKKVYKGGDDGCAINPNTGRCAKHGTTQSEKCKLGNTK